MSKGLIIFLVIFGLLFMGGCGAVQWGKNTYNGFVTEQESVDGQWANVENVYQRRADLIPNLVSTVKGYASHEKETFEAVIEARAKATQTKVDVSNMTPESMAAFQQSQQGLSGALGKLMVVVERYPDLKANQNFLDLQAQLEGTENRIAVERRKYNKEAKVYNAHIRMFPANIIANMFGPFLPKPYFEMKEGADVAPDVDFS